MQRALKRWWRSTTAIVTFWRLRAASSARRRIQDELELARKREEVLRSSDMPDEDEWRAWLDAFDARQSLRDRLTAALLREKFLALQLKQASQ